MNPEDVTIETLCAIPVREMPTSADLFMQKVEEYYDKVPSELAHTAKIMVDAVTHPGVTVADIRLVMTYERPLSDEEKEALVLARAKALLDFEEKERAELARLITKYGVPK